MKFYNWPGNRIARLVIQTRNNNDVLSTIAKRVNVMRIAIVVAVLLSELFRFAIAQDFSYIRFVEGNNQWEGELQTSILRFRNDADQYVSLIAAVHIADQEYYQQLNKLFADYDELLFELVTDTGDLQNLARNTQSSSSLSLVQNLLGNFLELEFQLSEINYAADNFRHADLTISELRDVMAAKDESFFSMFVTMATVQMAAEQEGIANNSIAPTALTMASLLRALSSDNQAQALKYLLAEELARSGGLTLSAEVESELTILGERNTAALAALSSSLKKGSGEIGLFYGAAHVPGLARALINEMGFTLESERWLTAWAIP